MVSKIKLRSLFILMTALLLSFLWQPSFSQAESFETKAETAIIVDADTGKILYAKDADEALPPASMTKMMTEYIILEEIDNGELEWNTTTQISDYVYSLSANNDFSGVGLRQNVDYTVKDLYRAMAINSDNATTVALAEMVAGSEGEFVKMMNKKAEEIGLEDYKFVNATGLDNESLDGDHPKGTKADETNLMSARSTALLAYRLISDYPEVLETSSIAETTFDGQEIRNWNWMLKHDASFLKDYYYEGIDGLKTGNTDLAGYTFTGTAERDGRRLITVVMKTDSVEDRFKETAKLMDYGFSKFEEEEIFPKGYEVTDKALPVAKGKKDQASVELGDSLSTTLQEGKEDDYKIAFKVDESLLNDDGELIAPIEKGDKIGKAALTTEKGNDDDYIGDNEENHTVDVIASEDIDKKNWFSLMLGGIGQFFINLYNKFMRLF